jgi:hypothetical protein
LIGNSSAGIIEAPSLGGWSIDIGIRQQGRERAGSVLNCYDTPQDLESTILTVKRIYPQEGKVFVNPYEYKNVLEKIISVITNKT